MTREIPHQEGMIEAIYDLALDPQKFESFTEAWEQYLSDHTLGHQDRTELPTAITKHFDRAFKILEKIGRAGSIEQHNLTEFIRNRASPALATTTDGTVTNINLPAVDLFTPTAQGASVFTLFHANSQKPLRRGLAQLTAAESSLPLLALLPNRLPVLLLMQYVADANSIVIDVTGSSWDDRVNATLRSMYTLTDRECEIASLLFQGKNINAIAALENRSAETVRKHTKALLAKTDTHSQAQLMRLLTSLNIAHSETRPPVWLNSKSENHKITLHDGRQLAYYDTGEGPGRTIAVMHGLLHDPELPSEMHQGLLRAGYRIIGMSRPWYGESSPPTSNRNPLENSAADLGTLLDRLAIDKVTLLGSMAGSIHAYAFAAMFPERASQIINVAGVIPFVNDDQLKHMTKSLRAIVRTARYFPRLFPMLIRTAVSLIDNGDIGRLFESGYKSSPVDIKATRDPEIFARLSTGYRFAVHNGYAAYTYEGIAVAGDTSVYSDKVKSPVSLIHGEHDGLTSAAAVGQFASDAPSRDLHLINGAGHLVMYTHPDTVTQLVLNCLSEGQTG